MKKITLILIILLLGVLLYIFISKYNHRNDVYISKDRLSKLDSIINLEPDTVFYTDTIWDTITNEIKSIINHQEKINDSLTFVLDTISDDNIDIFIMDTLRHNYIYSRNLKYNLKIPEIVKSAEIVKKVPVIVEKQNNGFYGVLNIGNTLSAELLYLNDDRLYGAGSGYVNGKFYYYAKIGFRF